MLVNKTTDNEIIGEIKCTWHPLTPWVNYVLRTAKGTEYENKDFKAKLVYASKKDEDIEQIFKPLIINCYDGLVLFKYKSYIDLEELGYRFEDFFSYEGGLYKECRSIVFDEYDGTIALASMAKFKNYGEDVESYKQWSVERLNSLYDSCYKFYITNKMDGSYLQFSWNERRKRIIGSSSKNIDRNLTFILDEGYRMLNEADRSLIKDFSDWTFIYEFIHPDNQIVVNYSKEQTGIYLIGARNKYTGQEMEFDLLSCLVDYYNCICCDWSEVKNIKIVEWYDKESLDSILSQVSKFKSSEKEGWVVDCWSGDLKFNHLRFKIKTDDYILMHKALSRLVSPNAIIQSLAEDKWDDFYACVPLGYKDYANNIAKEVCGYIKTITETYHKFYMRLLTSNYKELLANRKATMIWITNNVPKFLRGYVINYYLGKENTPLKNHGGGYRKRNELKNLAEKCKKVLNSMEE